jgi:biopolymer transport protein ExbD
VPSLSQSDGEDLANDQIIAEINITPLTDVFLVLLIIFMVTTSVIANQGKEVNLPEAVEAETTPQGVAVTITETGEIQVDGVTVSEKQLPAVMKAKLDKAPADGKVVILRGDRKVILGTAVNVLDIAQQAGARGFALATRPPRGG